MTVIKASLPVSSIERPQERPPRKQSLYRLFANSLIGYLVVIALVVAAVAWRANELQRANARSAISAEFIRGAGDLRNLASERMTSSGERIRTQWQWEMRALRDQLKQFERQALPAQHVRSIALRLDALDRALEEYLPHRDEEATRALLIDNIVREADLLALAARDIGVNADAEVARQVDKVVASVGGGAGVMTLLFLAIVWLACIRVAKPVAELSDAIARMGANAVPVPDARLVELEGIVAALNSLNRRLAETMVSRDRLLAEIEQRREAERALQLSEVRHRRLVESISALVVEIDREGRIVFANETMRAMTGLARDELLGRSWQSAFNIGTPFAELKAAARRMLRGNDVRGFVMTCTSRAGVHHMVEWNTANEYDAHGRLRKIVALGIDITARRRAEQQLRQSAARLRTAQEVARIGDWDFNVETRHITWSPQLYRLFERDAALGPAWPEELLGLCVPNCARRLPECPESPPACLQEWSVAKERVELERRVALMDGRSAWHSNTIIISRDEKGSIVKLHGTVQDITERKLAEEALRQSEERFRALVTATSDAVYRMNADWSEMVELSVDSSTKLAGREWLEKCVPVDERPKVIAAVNEAIGTKTPFQLEHRVLRRDGTIGWTLSRAVPITNGDGDIVEWFGAATDITARRRVEEEIEDLYQNAPCGYCSINADGLIVRMNETLLAWLGYSRSEVVGRLHISELMTTGSLQAYQCRKQLLQLDGQILRAECEFIRENRTVLPVLLNATSLRDAQNRFVRIRAMVIDITDKRLVEKERLVTAQRLAELSRELVAVQEEERRRLARELHDRTSPNLVAVALNLRVIAKKIGEHAAEDVASRLTDTNALLDNTIANIRDITADLHPSILDHAGLLAALEEYARQFTRRTGIAVKVSGSSAELGIEPDQQGALFRIAQEALTNCAKHAKATLVRLNLEKESGGAVRLAIVDDGAGFDPGSLKAGGKARGLGLLTMRERAEFAGGHFTFNSQPGKGTRVQVRIEVGA